jgi:hypothetical protein
MQESIVGHGEHADGMKNATGDRQAAPDGGGAVELPEPVETWFRQTWESINERVDRGDTSMPLHDVVALVDDLSDILLALPQPPAGDAGALRVRELESALLYLRDAFHMAIHTGEGKRGGTCRLYPCLSANNALAATLPPPTPARAAAEEGA